MRIIICGSRNWRDSKIIYNRLRKFKRLDQFLIGDARGVDDIATDFIEQLWPKEALNIFKAHWDKSGRSAGIKRNLEMLDQRPKLIVAFWDGKSRGTGFMINTALKRRIPLEVHFSFRVKKRKKK